jgi:phospholipid/cholesterol/gamma-HCH transport system substrate-binding protein
MTSMLSTSRVRSGAAVLLSLTCLTGCADWQGANSLPLPGTEGRGAGSYEVQAQLPNVTNIERNSRVRVGDVTVGSISKIERQGWHALVTIRLNSDVVLPANATATVGQTSLLGTLHLELAPPVGIPPEGRLQRGSLIPLASSGGFPTTEQTLGALSMLLNGGGLGQIQDITKAFSTAFAGRENNLRSLIEQLDQFIGHLEAQKSDIIQANESLNRLVSQFADQRPILDRALDTIPRALTVLKDQRENLANALDKLGKFAALANDSASQTKEALVAELTSLAPVLDSLANAGPSLTRSLSLLATFPWPAETLQNWFRGDYGNLTAIIDLTLSRLDASFLTGTRFEGELTELELQWGRTIGQLPSPYTAGNPLIVPYNGNQGP